MTTIALSSDQLSVLRNSNKVNLNERHFDYDVAEGTLVEITNTQKRGYPKHVGTVISFLRVTPTAANLTVQL